MKLRPLEEGDFGGLAQLYPGTEAELRRDLGDGRDVVVAVRGDQIAGCAGVWIHGADCFGAPVLVADPGAGLTLAGHVAERARKAGATRARISCTPEEAEQKLAGLRAHGFKPIFDFVTLVRPAGAASPAPSGHPRIPFEELDLERFTELHNAAMAGIPNAPALSAAQLRRDLDAPITARDLTAVWGDYAGLIQVERDRDDRGAYATIAVIAVRDEARRQGLALTMLDDVLARASDVGEIRALVASTNEPSLALFGARSFTERARRTVYEKRL